MSKTVGVDTIRIGNGLPNCLYFPTVAEGGPTHVDHGKMYEPSIVISNQAFMEGWARWDSGQYLVSYGAGGDHAFLIGYDINGKLSGNFWDNSAGVTFGSDDAVLPGEWHHWAVGYNDVFCETYINGVPSGRVVTTANRYSGDNNNLMIGGSDHSNFYGALASIRQFEGLCPTAKFSFRPDRFFECTRFATLDAYVGTATILLADYTKPCAMIPDYGRYTGSVHHPGRLCNASAIDGVGAPLFKSPTPYWIYDPKCPVQAGTPPLTTEWGGAVPTPTTPPGGCRIFDSFGRTDQTRATEAANAVGLGSTEGGSLGPKVWNSTEAWGIFRKNAILLHQSNIAKSVAWVENSVADMDVSVTRRPHGGGGRATGDVGLVLRWVDASNYVKCFLYRSIFGGDDKIYVAGYVAGVATEYIGAATPSSASFGTLRCTCKTTTGVTTWTVYTDGTQIATVAGGEANASATKCGMLLEWLATPANAHGHARYSNFTVAATP